MQIVEEANNKNKLWGDCRIFSHRFARMCILKVKCGPDHIVTKTEEGLIDLAKSDIKKSIISYYSNDEIPGIIAVISRLVRMEVRNRIDSYVLSDGERNKILEEAKNLKLKDLVPVIN